MDLEYKLTMQREEKKDKKEDEIKLINEEYNAFSEAFLNEFVYHIVPEKKEEEPKKGGRR
jgi:hypothetical protein